MKGLASMLQSSIPCPLGKTETIEYPIQFVENPRGPILPIEVKGFGVLEIDLQKVIEATKQGILRRMQRIGQKDYLIAYFIGS